MANHNLVTTTYHNLIGSLAPVLNVASGDTIVTRTLDAAGNDSEGNPKAIGPNPMSGPIFVEGAEPGHALKVEILKMIPASDSGYSRNLIAPNVIDPDAVRNLPPSERIYWRIDRKAGSVRLANPIPGLEEFVRPLAPMIGCFGVAPNLGQSISTATSGRYGGNMDYRLFGPGATVWLPVFAPGALFFLGDCHAAQGDGEIVGTGVETTFDVTFRLTVEKQMTVNWPRGMTSDDIFTIGNARPLDQALQHATTEMLTWLGTDYGLSKSAASVLLGQVVRYDIGNVYNPAYTVACRVAKKWLRLSGAQSRS